MGHSPPRRSSRWDSERDRSRSRERRHHSSSHRYSRSPGRDGDRNGRQRKRSRSKNRSRSRSSGRRRTRDRRSSSPRDHHAAAQLQGGQSPAGPVRPSSPARAPLSHGSDARRYPQAVRLPQPPPPSTVPPEVGSIHRGRVHNIRPFGMFVRIRGCQRDVLVYHSQVSDLVTLTKEDEDEMKVKALEFAASQGQEVWVKVLEVNPDPNGPGFRVHGSMRVVDQEEGLDLDPTGEKAAAGGGGGGGGGLRSDDPPEEGSLHRGQVKRIEPYGVFVALQGYRKYGLVHASQVVNYIEFTSEDTDEDKRRAIGEVVAVGDTVWVKVVEVTPDDGGGRGPRIGCSMKLVSQADGKDLDPQGVRYVPRGEGGGRGGGRGPIGADVGEIKGGAIDWGYMKGEVKQYGDGKNYDLLPEGEEVQARSSGPSRAVGPGPGGGPGAVVGLAPAGRGRGAVLPAWMAGGGGGGGGLVPAAPGAPGAPEGPGLYPGPPEYPGPPKSTGGGINSVEEALAVLKAAAGRKSKHKKKGKGKKEKKGKEKQKHKHKHKDEKKSGSKRGDQEDSSRHGRGSSRGGSAEQQEGHGKGKSRSRSREGAGRGSRGRGHGSSSGSSSSSGSESR